MATRLAQQVRDTGHRATVWVRGRLPGHGRPPGRNRLPGEPALGAEHPAKDRTFRRPLGDLVKELTDNRTKGP